MTNRVASWAGFFDQFCSFYSFLPSVEGSHQRRPCCWGRSELEGQSCDVHVQRKLQSRAATRRSWSCWYVPTQPGLQRNQRTSAQRTLPLFFPRFPPSPSPDLVSFLFVLLELSPPFPCFKLFFLPSSRKTFALLGLRSRTSRLSWRPQPCRNTNSPSAPRRNNSGEANRKASLLPSKMAPGRSKGKQPARPRDETSRSIPTPKTQRLYNAFRQLEDEESLTPYASPDSSRPHPTADPETEDGQPPAKRQKAQRNGPLGDLKRARAAFIRVIRACQDCHSRSVAVSCLASHANVQALTSS